MMITANLVLNKGKEVSVKRHHPWIFSGAIKRIEGEPKDGDLIEVSSFKGEFLGIGHFQKGSITVRIITFINEPIDSEFWKRKIENARILRKIMGYIGSAVTNAYRLFFGEADGIPGLVIDMYNGTAVIQAHSIGVHENRNEVVQALRDVFGTELSAVYYKSETTLRNSEQVNSKSGYLFGKQESNEICENNHKFIVDWETGQKTGYFLDQKENRLLLARYSKDKTVLDTFCHSGGFSVYALRAGAKHVTSVDSSKRAIELVEKNLMLNKLTKGCLTVNADVLKYLSSTEELYDVIVLDPPAFAKHRDVRHNALMAYKRLNTEGIKRVNSGGIVFTFSCSQVVDKYLFTNTIMAAAIESGRNVKIIHRLTQPPDHPVGVFHPEGEYLKGLVLYVE